MLPNDTLRIPLFNRDGSIIAHALIDAADKPLLDNYSWRLILNRYAGRRTSVNGRKVLILLHRVILGLPTWSDGRHTDHINRDGLDNRRSNLRIVTHAQNMQNKPSSKGSTSKFRGVSWEKKRKTWRADIRVGGKHSYLGYFATEAEAGAVALAARRKLLPFAVD